VVMFSSISFCSCFFFFSSRRRHTRWPRDWSSDVCSSDLGIAGKMTQTEWLNEMKNNGCVGCHQLGQLSTRTIEPSLGHFPSSEEAWIRRVQSGQAAQFMMGQLSGMGPLAVKNLADWTDRVARGELPHAKPQRPQGVERNIVVTLRDWMDEK